MYLENHRLTADTKAIETTRASLAALKDILQVKTVAYPCENDSFYLAIQQHRREYYTSSAPHLLSAAEQAIELAVDRRSVIYTVCMGPTILSSLRLTPRPFELEQFNLHVDFSSLKNYLEIGRLVSNPKLDSLTTALVVRFLLCGAGLGAIEQHNCAGLVAICRPFRLSFFNKFGLIKQFTFFSEQRQIEYHFLTAPMPIILSFTTALQKNEKALRNRLSKLSRNEK